MEPETNGVINEHLAGELGSRRRFSKKGEGIPQGQGSGVLSSWLLLLWTSKEEVSRPRVREPD